MYFFNILFKDIFIPKTLFADVTKPRIENCIPFAHGIAYPNSIIGNIEWSEPKVTDNYIDKYDSIELKKNSNISSGDNVTVGSHEIIFTAQDKAGNEAKPCKITLQMKGMQ